jgi:adenine-specific DNA-methyltransferase
LNFERHRPEAVELPQRPIRKGDKVRVLPERGSTQKGDQRLWAVKSITKSGQDSVATISLLFADEPETQEVSVDDLVVVAEFQDYIYPGLVSTGKVERGGDKPFHTVINGENYHALKALTYTHRGKVDAIYIDPPYNTGARDWKYNNDYVEAEDLYRHSKWLAMMERRLKLSKALLNPIDSVLIVTIDEKEYLRLGLLLNQLFPAARIQMVSIAINPAAVARSAAFGRLDEYAFFVMFGESSPKKLRLSREWLTGKGRTHTGKIRWDLLRRSGTRTQREDSPGCFYPIYIDPDSSKIISVGDALNPKESNAKDVEGATALLPIRQDGSEGNWQWSPNLLRERLGQGRVKVGGNSSRGFTIYILKPGEFKKIEDGEYEITGYGPNGDLEVRPTGEDDGLISTTPSSQWRIKAHDATQYGSRLLSKILPGTNFPFPKSLYAVEDTLRFFVSDKKDAIVLDYFAGSGTTDLA